MSKYIAVEVITAVTKECGLLVCNAVQFGESQTFRRNISSTSGSKIKPSRKNRSACRLYVLVSCLDNFSTLKKEAIRSSETWGSLRTTRHLNLEERKIYLKIWFSKLPQSFNIFPLHKPSRNFSISTFNCRHFIFVKLTNIKRTDGDYRAV
jgi:hypothetical protein